MPRLEFLFFITLAASIASSTFIASSTLAMDAPGPEKTTEALEIKFSRAFGAPADGSWDGLFSGDNVLDPIKYANEEPEQTIFKSGQAQPRRATRSGTEQPHPYGVTGPTFL